MNHCDQRRGGGLRRQFSDNPWLGVIALLLPLIASTVIFCTLPIEIGHRVIRENRLVENLSAVAHFLTAAYCLILAYKRGWRDGWIVAFIPFFFGCRELEFQERFTALSITKLRFYTDPDIPGMQKAVVLVVIALSVGVIVRCLQRHTSNFFRILRLRRPYALSILSGMALLVLSKICDTGHGMLIRFGVPLTYDDEIRASVAEEFLELGAPILFLVAVFQFLCAGGDFYGEGETDRGT